MTDQNWPGDTRPLYVRALENRANAFRKKQELAAMLRVANPKNIPLGNLPRCGRCGRAIDRQRLYLGRCRCHERRPPQEDPV